MMSQENQLQRLKSNWRDVNTETRSRYILQNMHKADCSFLVKDQNMKNFQKILKSFQWILTDISPHFKKRFKFIPDRKEIPIGNSSFEDFLLYVHTGILPDLFDLPFERLVQLYELSKIYEVSKLKIDIINMLSSMNEQGNILEINWIYYFEMVYAKKLKIPDLADAIESALCKLRGDQLKKVIEMNTNRIMTFDVDLFISFITHISRREPFTTPLVERPIILQTIETYLEKNPSFEETIKKEKLAKNAFVLILYINQNPKQINLQHFKDYPKIKELLI